LHWNIRKSIISLCFILIFGCVNASADIENGTLVFGEISSQPQYTKKLLSPIADYVVKHMKMPGVNKAEVLVTDNLEDMLKLIKAKKVDILMETLHPVIYMKKKGINLKPILSYWRKDSSEIRGIFITKKNNDEINTLDNLIGKLVVFNSMADTATNLIPRAHLLEKKYKLNYSAPNDPEAINIIFANSLNEIENKIRNGQVDAGITSSHRFDNLTEDATKSFKVIDKTSLFPSYIVSVAPMCLLCTPKKSRIFYCRWHKIQRASFIWQDIIGRRKLMKSLRIWRIA